MVILSYLSMSHLYKLIAFVSVKLYCLITLISHIVQLLIGSFIVSVYVRIFPLNMRNMITGCPLVLIFLIFLILSWFGKFGLDLLIFSWYFIKFQEKSWFFVQALWLFHLQIFVSIVFSGNEVFVLNNRASKLYTMYRNVWFAI